MLKHNNANDNTNDDDDDDSDINDNNTNNILALEVPPSMTSLLGDLTAWLNRHRNSLAIPTGTHLRGLFSQAVRSPKRDVMLGGTSRASICLVLVLVL